MLSKKDAEIIKLKSLATTEFQVSSEVQYFLKDIAPYNHTLISKDFKLDCC